jgi:hypothetical protein
VIRLRRLLPALLLVGAACHSWRTDARPVAEIVRADSPAELRVRRTDGSIVTLGKPRLVSDTSRVIGTGSDSAGASDTLVAGSLLDRKLATGETARGGGRRNATVLVRTSDIAAVEVLRPSRARTWAAIGSVAAFIALVVIVGPYGSGSDY